MFWIKYISYHKRTSYFKAHMPISTCLRIKMSVTAYLICSSVAGVELCQTQNLPQPPLFYYSTIVEYYFFFFNNAKIEANTLKMVLVLFCLSHPTSRHIWDLYFKEVLSTEFIFVSSVHSCTTDFKAYCFHSPAIIYQIRDPWKMVCSIIPHTTISGPFHTWVHSTVFFQTEIKVIKCVSK